MKSDSIVETSLTELAFIFFFILLAFSTLKLSEVNDENKNLSELRKNLLLEKNTYHSALVNIAQAFDNTESDINLIQNKPQLPDVSIDMNAPFQGLDSLTEKTIETIEKYQALETNLGTNTTELVELSGIAEELKALANVAENASLDDALETIERNLADIKGQNVNLRNKLEDLGNGLVYPPCWANPQSGAIEYVYNITITEESISVLAAWPKHREAEISQKPHISSSIGTYDQQQTFWRATQRLYQESVEKECRHFVRVYDEAESKDAFKKFLLTIERHFYKLLI